MPKRTTRQKELLKKELKDKKTFFTAEEFYNSIQKKEQKIGIATIYRFLKEQEEKKNIHKYICNRKTLYSLEEKTHAHFYCEECKKEKHLNIKQVDFLKNEVSEEICHFQLNITGICKECKKTIKEKKHLR